jgi:iron(III) transport system substrate-binding protein
MKPLSALRLTLAALLLGALQLAAAPALAQKTQLLVYTALETDQIKAYQEAFNKAYPDVELKFVRDSTGVITAKVLAEKANPQADMVIGTSASSMAVFANEGMLEPYAPKGVEKIPAQYRDSQNPPRWVGMDIYGAAICFNTVEAQKQNLPKPTSWKDLTKPVYKGKIVMPNPASSGTGFLDVSAGSRCGVSRTHGSSWTRCTTTSASIRIPDRSPAARRARASSRSASRSSTARWRRRSRARRSTSSSRRRAWAGTSRRAAS